MKKTQELDSFFRLISKMANSLGIKEEGWYKIEIGFKFSGNGSFNFLKPKLHKLMFNEEIENKI